MDLENFFVLGMQFSSSQQQSWDEERGLTRRRDPTHDGRRL